MNPENKINEMVEELSGDVFGCFAPSDFKDTTLKSDLCKAAKIGLLAMDIDEGDSYRKYTEAVQKLEKAIEAIKTD